MSPSPEELVDPVQEAVVGAIVGAPALPRLAGQHLTLLNNMKPGGEELLRAIGAELTRRFGCTFEYHSKPDTTIVPDVIFRELSARSRGIITGLGD